MLPALLALGCGAGEDLVQPTTGTLQIAVSTSGDFPDADGYTVVVDGGQARAVGTSDTLTDPAVAPGDHRVQLGGLAANCAVEGLNPVAVTVVLGETVEVELRVVCSAPPAATLSVAVVTTGSPPDPDGYLVFVDAAPSQSIGPSDTVSFAGLVPGPHAVRLGGVAEGCGVHDENPRTVDVPAGGAAASFEVACWPPPTGVIAFRGSRPGDPPDDPASFQFDILSRNADGTGLRNLTSTVHADEWNPAWSPDGSRIAFQRTDSADGIVVMRADGSDPVQITDGGGSQPLWSPDGTKLLFLLDGLAVVNVNGGGFKRLAEGDIEGYAWSPDGKRVAFDLSTFGGPSAVYTISAAGTQPVNLTGDEPDASHHVYAWSPDGKWIAFVRESGSAADRGDIYLAAADGSAPPVNLTQRPARYGSVAWSPTGATLAFARSLVPGEEGSFFELDVCTIEADGTGFRQLTNDPDLYESIGWSPDGTKLVLEKLGDGVFIMNPDGSGMRRLTTGEGVATEPAWRP